LARYDEAVARPDVKVEALLRAGYFELRRGHADAALLRFREADSLPEDDVVLRFWFHLLNGQALEQANRLSEAIDSYRLALDDVPSATSARAALVSALVRNNQGSDGARIAREALLTFSATLDPWTIYVEPDMRYWKAISQQFRKVVEK
jgi:tetratricopeptide (TPR) repeat protein